MSATWSPTRDCCSAATAVKGASSHLSRRIKVLRPGVIEQVAVDLCVLLRASEVMATWVPRVLPNSRIDWRALLLALSTALWEETNLDGEA